LLELQAKCSVWVDHRFTRAREPVNSKLKQNQMTENQIFEAQKKRIYKRMGIGSILGGFIFLAAGLGIAWFGNNMNPGLDGESWFWRHLVWLSEPYWVR
jgi:hypothetical protein